MLEPALSKTSKVIKRGLIRLGLTISYTTVNLKETTVAKTQFH